MKRLSILVMLIVFSGCLKKRKEYLFEQIKPEKATCFVEERMHIRCTVKKLSAKEEHELFGNAFGSVDIAPFYLEVENNSSDMWYFSARHISAPLASEATLKEALHIPQTYAWLSSLVAFVYCWPLIPVVIAPAAFWSYNQNKETDRFLEDHSMRARERCFYIAPHERIKKLICIYGWESGTKFDIAVTRDKDGLVTKFLVTL